MRALLYSLILLLPAQVFGGTDEFRKKDASRVVFENSLFHYHAKNYILAAYQFNSLLEEFPEYKKAEVPGYFILSLSNLGQDAAVEENLEKYKATISSHLLLTLVNTYQAGGGHKKASRILDLISFDSLSSNEKMTYSFLKARSEIVFREYEKAKKNLKAIGKGSRLYWESQVFLSRIAFAENDVKGAITGLTKLTETFGMKKGRLDPGKESREKATLLLGQYFFERGDYKKALSYFRKIGAGKLQIESLEGQVWCRIKEGKYKKASGILGELKEQFPFHYDRSDLPMTSLLATYYSGNIEKTKSSLSELEKLIEEKSAFSKKILQSDEISERYIYYLLANFSDIHVLQKYSLTEDEKHLFRLFRVNPEIVRLSGSYVLLRQMMEENMRGVNLFGDFVSVFKKRRELFKNFIDLFRFLRPTYFSLKKIIMEIEIPFDQIPEKNVQYVEARLKIALKEYAEKFKHPLTKLETQLIKILVYEEYVSYRGIERNLPLFTLTLKMMNILQGLYGDSGKAWEDDFNRAVEEHNKSVRMIKRLNTFPKVNKELKKVKRQIDAMITAYLQKEAFRVIRQNERFSKTVAAVREDILIQEALKDDAGK